MVKIFAIFLSHSLISIQAQIILERYTFVNEVNLTSDVNHVGMRSHMFSITSCSILCTSESTCNVVQFDPESKACNLYQKSSSAPFSNGTDSAYVTANLMDQTSSGSSGPTTTTAGPLADPTGAASVPSGWTKLLLTSGHYLDTDYKGVLESEVLDLENPSATCESLADSPFVTSASGGLMNGNQPIICGGRTDLLLTTEIDQCYSLGSPDPVISLLEARALSAGIMLDNGALWITGGLDTGTGISKTSTEFVTLSGSTAGPTLPEAKDRHCISQYDASSVIVIGGYPNDGSTFVYNFATDSWTNGPSLRQGRHDAACGLLTDTVDSSSILAIAGGSKGDQYYEDTEFAVVSDPTPAFTTQSTSFYTLSRHLAVVAYDGASLIFGSGAFYGYDDIASANLYPTTGAFLLLHKLSCANRVCTIEELGHTVKQREEGIAMLIPDTMANCV